MIPNLLRCRVGIFSFLVLGCSFAYGQDWLSKAIPPEARLHDFGTVARAANTEHRFEIKNTLNQDMTISSVRASCGCTTPIVETKTIKPGKVGTILARFNTGTFTGQKQATLTVTITQPFLTEVQLNVRGYIRSDIVLSPGEIQFGQVSQGDGKTSEVMLDYAGKSTWEIQKISSPLPFVGVKFEEVSRVSGRIRYKIITTLDDSAPAGFLQNQLVLHTNDQRLPTVPVRLLADIQPPIQFSPSSFELGTVSRGEPIQQRLVVKGKEPFRILDITSEVADITFKPIEEAKSAHLINITLKPNAAKELTKVDSHIILKTDWNDTSFKVGLTYETLAQKPSNPTVVSMNSKQ